MLVDDDDSFLSFPSQQDGVASAYVCQGPVTDPQELRHLLLPSLAF